MAHSGRVYSSRLSCVVRPVAGPGHPPTEDPSAHPDQHFSFTGREAHHALVTFRAESFAWRWSLDFRFDRDHVACTAAYMSLIRPICQPVLGISAKGLDDDVVCAICGSPSASLLRDLELVALAPTFGQQSCQALHALLADSSWLKELAKAWNRLCSPEAPPVSSSELLDSLCREPAAALATVPATKCWTRLQRRADRARAVVNAQERHVACQTGWALSINHHAQPTSVPSVATAVHLLLAWQCASSTDTVAAITASAQFAAPIFGNHTGSAITYASIWAVCFRWSSRMWILRVISGPLIINLFGALQLKYLLCSSVFSEHAACNSKTLEALALALKKQHPPKGALEALFERVRGALSSTECALADLVHPTYSYAAWLAHTSGGLARFDGIGFR